MRLFLFLYFLFVRDRSNLQGCGVKGTIAVCFSFFYLQYNCAANVIQWYQQITTDCAYVSIENKKSARTLQFF